MPPKPIKFTKFYITAKFEWQKAAAGEPCRPLQTDVMRHNSINKCTLPSHDGSFPVYVKKTARRRLVGRIQKQVEILNRQQVNLFGRQEHWRHTVSEIEYWASGEQLREKSPTIEMAWGETAYTQLEGDKSH
ncbi:MAG TPA: hypothetical protein DEA22_00135 [Blastocatellia bacterium]|nr:hypothetical protein [Blastocatellia bacterium]